MNGSDAQVLLHPVRIGILMVLAQREATPQEIAAAVPDVPKASLYRHLNILRAVGAIREVREYRVRGTYEKVYGLETQTGPLAGLSPKDERPTARVSEWLSRLVRPEGSEDAYAVATQETFSWRRTAMLSTEQADQLRAHIEDWFNEHATSGKERETQAHVIRIDCSDATTSSNNGGSHDHR